MEPTITYSPTSRPTPQGAIYYTSFEYGNFPYFGQQQQEPKYCSKDLKPCNDGSYVGRDPNNDCMFYRCPDEKKGCEEDARMCDDGITVVVRDPMNDCMFFPCPDDDMRLLEKDEEEIPMWSTTTNANDSSLVWERTDDEAYVGSWSLETPNLDTPLKNTTSANVTLTIPDYGVAGTLYFWVYAGCQMPFDQVSKPEKLSYFGINVCCGELFSNTVLTFAPPLLAIQV